MPVRTIEELQRLFACHGVQTLYVKQLAPKQDNEKNQIYLGSGLDGILNLFPADIVARAPSASIAKRKSKAGQAKLEGRIRLAWLSDDGGDYAVLPAARIIDYFQYPEARLSGLLNRLKLAPDALRRRNLAQYGRRILVLGTTRAGIVLGKVLTQRDDPLVSSFPDLPVLAAAPVFRVLSTTAAAGVAPLHLLIGELRAIVAAASSSIRWR